MRTKWVEFDHLDRAWKFSGAKLYLKKEGAKARGWTFNAFLSSDYDYMGESSGTPYDLKVTDCNGNLVSMVANVNEIFRSANAANAANGVTEDTKSGFFTIMSRAPSANEAFIFDLSQPDPKPLVKFEQREPCWLWPLCTYLPDQGIKALLPWVAREWTGEIVQEGYGQVIGTLPDDNGEGFVESTGANAAIDVRFLALWSLHVFGASKFSPAQQWIMGLSFIFLTSWCCAHCMFSKKEQREFKLPEEEPIYASSMPDGRARYSSPWNCCSRRSPASNYAASIKGYSLSALATEMKKSGADQNEINQCLDTEDPKATLMTTLVAKNSSQLMSSRGALE
jgi:hypothetical protein